MKVKDNFNDKVFAVKVSGQQCKKHIFLIHKTLRSCISLLLSGSTEVEGGEAGSSGAAERRSHHPGITMHNCQPHYDGNTRWKYTFRVSEDQK